MNVGEINPGTNGTLPHYVAVALPLTLITAWIIIAFQSTYIFETETTFLKRLGWPVYLVHMMLKNRNKKVEEEKKLDEFTTRNSSHISLKVLDEHGGSVSMNSVQ